MTEPVLQTTRCLCGAVLVILDEEAAENLFVVGVRKRWLRGDCSKCKTIVYASILHYIPRDW